MAQLLLLSSWSLNAKTIAATAGAHLHSNPIYIVQPYKNHLRLNAIRHMRLSLFLLVWMHSACAIGLNTALGAIKLVARSLGASTCLSLYSREHCSAALCAQNQTQTRSIIHTVVQASNTSAKCMTCV